jgi:hypothetical protein
VVEHVVNLTQSTGTVLPIIVADWNNHRGNNEIVDLIGPGEIRWPVGTEVICDDKEGTRARGIIRRYSDRHPDLFYIYVYPDSFEWYDDEEAANGPPPAPSAPAPAPTPTPTVVTGSAGNSPKTRSPCTPTAAS